MTDRGAGRGRATPGSRAERRDRVGYHEPVLSNAVLQFLSPRAEKFYLDGTVGGGGHARRILEKCRACRVLAVDRDPEALTAARAALGEYRDRVRFVHSRFDRAPADTEVRDRGLDGVLLDLGVSSHQLDEEDRGFAFRRGVALDMRMDTTQGNDAALLLASASEDRLVSVFRDYGEEPRARVLAREILKRRVSAPVETSDDLVAALSVALRRSPSRQDKARIFQAVRIAVNEELESLEMGLPAILEALNDRAILVVIAYHSLEDGVVKNAFREWSKECICPPEFPLCTCRGVPLGETLTRKPVRPDRDEIERNPRASSARLRAWRRAA